MAFNAYGTTSSNSSSKNSVDFDALNKAVVEACQLDDGETLVGVVSSLVDLGTQKLEDSEYNVDEGDESLSVEELTEKYSSEISKGSISKFDLAWDNDSRSRKIKKFVPQKDRQCVVYSVDFPDILVDKAPFFGGESSPQPLRLYAGGEWFEQEKRQVVVSSPIALKVTKDDDNNWTMHQLSQLRKMAVGAKVVTKKEPFLPQQIDQLVGKSLQFKAQVAFNDKGYYFEKLSFVGGLARDQTERSIDESFIIGFDDDNDEKALKELRKHVINTMAKATNWEGSKVREQLIALGKFKEVVKPTNDSIADAANNSPTDNSVDELW